MGAAGLVGIFSIYTLFHLPEIIVQNGFILFGFVLIYFGIVNLLGLQKVLYKEPSIAILYSLGIFLAPLSLYPQEIPLPVLGLLLEYIFLAYLNLLLFAYFEFSIDEMENHVSSVRFWGVSNARKMMFGICMGFLLVFSGVLLQSFQDFTLLKIQAIALLMFISLAWILFYEDAFKKKNRYRVLGDAVFLYPIIYFLL